ncbi:cytidine deaminase [Prevotellaceae bacterium MN60]|nr:cytidine deaminase [Prevotellaceae bacterium MN60]
MKELTLKSTIHVADFSELTDQERKLIEEAKAATHHSYAPYSHFHVGAALLLKNGIMVPGCNQENAAFPSGLCAERSAIFAAGAQYPDQAVTMLAIAVRNSKGEFLEEPASPCGSCRQVIIETETRFKQPVRILLYGTKHTYVMDGIKELMPLSFTEF